MLEIHKNQIIKLIFICLILFDFQINYSQDIKAIDALKTNDTFSKKPLLLGKITRNA